MKIDGAQNPLHFVPSKSLEITHQENGQLKLDLKSSAEINQSWGKSNKVKRFQILLDKHLTTKEIQREKSIIKTRPNFSSNKPMYSHQLQDREIDVSKQGEISAQRPISHKQRIRKLKSEGEVSFLYLRPRKYSLNHSHQISCNK